MAEFLTLKKLEEKITDIIFEAKKDLLVLSPYIKLDDHFKKLFSNHLNNPEVHIILVFGKNEDNKGKSLRKEDFEFFKKFPCISILYLKDLHAKYYANEEEGVVTSINLHDYSFKNNIEFGVHSKNPAQSILGITSFNNPFSDSIDSSAWEYAMGFMKQAEAVFIKRPMKQKKLFGLSVTHMGSEVCHDSTDFFQPGAFGKKQSAIKRFDDFPEFIEYGKATYAEKPTREPEAPIQNQKETKKERVPPINYSNNQHSYSNQWNNNGYNQATAFCIRSGNRIKFNPNFPYSEPAYNSWKQWKNEDYTESFCHSCGRPTPTSKRKPLCESCFYN